MNPKYTKTHFSPGFLSICLGLTAGITQIVSAVEVDGTFNNPDAASFNWSDTGNWEDGIIADGTDAVATFNNQPFTGTPGVVVDTNITIGSLIYTNTSGGVADLVLNGSVGNALTFATSSGPGLIEMTSASSRLLNLGGGTQLNIQGTQGLIIRNEPGGALTGTGLDATSGSGNKFIRVYDIDWTSFSGGVSVDRGVIELRNANQLGSGATTQGLTVGTVDSVTYDMLAGVNNSGNHTDITTLDGNSLGRIYGSGTFTVGAENASGGDFGGVFGTNFAGDADSTGLTKTGTGTQTISGRLNTTGTVTVDDGNLNLTGTGHTIGGLAGATDGILDVPGDLTITNNGSNYNGLLTGAGTITIDGAGSTQKFSNNLNTISGSVIIAAGTLENNGNNGQTLGTANVQIGDASNQDATFALVGRTNMVSGQQITVVGAGTNVLDGQHNHTGQTHFTRGITLNNSDLTFRATAKAGFRLEDSDGTTTTDGVDGIGNITFEGNNTNGATPNNIDVRAAINNVGTVTNAGTAVSDGNALHITGSQGGQFGANVTSIIQNSATSDFIIDANNGDFTGTAVVTTGTMRLLSETSFNSVNTVTVDSEGILDVQNNVTIGALVDGTGAGTVTNEGAADQVLTLGGSGTHSFSGVIQDGATHTLGVATSGTGTHTLAGDNTYNGDTTVGASATLKLGHPNALGTSGFVPGIFETVQVCSTYTDIDADVIDVANTAELMLGDTVTGPGIPEGATITEFEPLGPLTVRMSADATADAYDIDITFSRVEDVPAGKTFITTYASLDLNGQTIAEEFSDIAGLIINSDLTTTAEITEEIVDLGNAQFGGEGDIIVSNIRRTNGVTRRTTKSGSGTLTLGGDLDNNRYGLTVNEGDVILAKTAGEAVSRFALIMNNAASTVTLQGRGDQIGNQDDAEGLHQINEGTLNLNGFDESIAALSTTLGTEPGGIVTNSAAGGAVTFTLLGSSEDATWPGTITGNLNLIKAGANTQTLTGTNTFSGSTTVTGGTLALDGDALSDAGSLIIDGGLVAVTGTETVNKLFVGTTQQAAGIYTNAEISAITSGTIVVTTGPSADDYGDWATENGLVGGPTDDDDNDGVSNKAEYAFGTDPTDGSSLSAYVGIDLDTASFTYTRRNIALTGFTYDYKFSIDLVDFTIGDSYTPVESSDGGDPIETVTVQIPLELVVPNDKLFLKIEAN